MSVLGSTAEFSTRAVGFRRVTATACLAAAIGCQAKPAATSDSSAANPAPAREASNAAPAGGTPVIAVVRAADWIGSEWSEDAIRVGLQEEGMKEGSDFTFKFYSAQGDLATLPGLIDAALDAKAKVIVTLQDPTLKVAVQRVKDTPIVFHVLADPFAAGAGTRDSSHLANVTGVYSPGLGDPEQEKRVALIRRMVPNAKRIGVLFSPDEPYAVQMKDKMTATARRSGIEVVGVPVATVNDGPSATATMLSRKVDAIEIFGNTAHAAFPSIMKGATEAKVPVFSPSPFEMLKGATAAIYPDFAEGGVVAGHMIGRIMKGERAGDIPFHKIETTKTKTNAQHALRSAPSATRLGVARAAVGARG